MGLARRQQNSANHSLHLHDAAVVVLLLIGAGAGVAPLLGLLGQLVVRVHGGRVLLPQSVGSILTLTNLNECLVRQPGPAPTCAPSP